jgi:type IV secretory pathway TraG/TraD family ATPase VirD4
MGEARPAGGGAGDMSAKGPTVGVFRQAAGAWVVLLCAWGIIGVLGLLWLAGGIANWVAGVGLSGPEFGFKFAKELVTLGPSQLWPHASPTVLWGVFALLLLVIGVPLLIIAMRYVATRPRAGDPLASLASHQDLASFTPAGVRERALALRPRLPEKYRSPAQRRDMPLGEAGVLLGELNPSGPSLRASWEDVAVAIMAPRSGKTTAEAVPAILDAPGAVVVTSNKADVWEATVDLRARQTNGTVWVFDPQGITHEPQTWWWDPLQDIGTYDAALRLARHFIQEVRQEGNDDFWISAATDLLTALILAAGVSGGTLYDVYRWLNDSGDDTPNELLRKKFGASDASAASLNARQAGADETREGIYETARTACRVLRNPEIMKWVVPPDRTPPGMQRPPLDLPAFDPVVFVESGQLRLPGSPAVPGTRLTTNPQTLYLLSKDGAAAAAPLVAALTDRVLHEGTRLAEKLDRGRLDAPMVVILDEAANICRIADLPALYSHLGSRGIFVLTILQSRPQARQVWGRDGFETMWSAATVKIVGAGIDDPELADDVSRLVGDHDVPVRSVTSSGTSHNESISLRKEAIMGASAVRAMPKGSALVLVTGAKPASITLTPWYSSTRADDVTQGIADASARKQANASGGPYQLSPGTPPRSPATASTASSVTVNLTEPPAELAPGTGDTSLTPSDR